MIRINLLPPEITDKRRAEQRWKYVVLGAMALYLALGAFWFVMFLQVTARSAEVAGKQQEAQALNTQANSFKVFADRQEDLAARQATADKALVGRVEWSKVLNELALVLPADAWLDGLRVDEKRFEITGSCVDAVGDTGSSGFKPLAKLLVHMSDLDELENVWLESTQRSKYEEQPVIKFTVAADVTKSADATPSASAPAPPSQP